MKNKLVTLSGFVLGAFSFSPLVVLAQTTGVTGGISTDCRTVGTGTIEAILCKFSQLLDTLIPVLVALGVVYFVYGVVSYVISSDEEAKKAGRDRIIYGIIGLAVIVSLWGLVKIVTNTFGIGTAGQNITFPTVPY